MPFTDFYKTVVLCALRRLQTNRHRGLSKQKQNDNVTELQNAVNL